MAIFAVEARKSLVDRNWEERKDQSWMCSRGSQEPRGSKFEHAIKVLESMEVEARKSLVDRND